MADNKINVGGRLHSIATGNVLGGANEIFDDDKNKKQSDINTETYSLVNDVNERLNGLSPDQQSALNVAAKATNNETKLGYYVCDTESNIAAKVISNATGYVLSPGGSMKVKITNANTVNNATLNINSTGAKALYYDGERASANNSWEAGETVEVYYDGTSFYANNIAGNGGDGVFDVSEKYPTSGVDGGNTYTLAGALAVLDANLSSGKKKGGMSIKFVQSSDNKYVQCRLIADSWSTNTENWAICSEDVLIENHEYIRVYTDKDGRILFGIKADASIEWAVGIPTPVKKYIEDAIAEITNGTEGINLDGLNKIIVFLSDFSTSNTLKDLLDTKVDKEEGKSLIDNEYAKSICFIENPEFIEVHFDTEDNILWAIKKNGSIYYGAGVPQQVIDYIEKKIEELSLDEYEDIVTFLADYLGNDTTLKAIINGINAAKVDKVEGKSLIDAEFAEGVSQTENPEFAEVHTDIEDKILYGVKKGGDFYFGAGVPSQIQDRLDNKADLADFVKVVEDVANKVDKEDGKSLIDTDYASSCSTIDDPEFMDVETDSEGKILSSRNNEGVKKEYVGFETPKATIGGHIIESIDDPEERSEITIDAEDRIISYRDRDGVKHEEVGIKLSEEGLSNLAKDLKTVGVGIMNWSDAKELRIAEPYCARINFTGIDGIPQAKGVNMHGIMQFWDMNGNYFRKEVIMNAQGSSSMSHPKKNIAIDICNNNGWDDDDTFSLQIGNWVPQDSFHLKGFYNDPFRGLCPVAYKWYDQIVKTRGELNDYIWKRALIDIDSITPTSNGSTTAKDTEAQYNTGARCFPDGFPCVVYLNGKFYGIYSWQLKKHRDNYHMNKKNKKNIHLDGVIGDATLFNGNINWTQFEVRNPKDLIDMSGNKYDGDNPTELIDSSSEYYDADNSKHVNTATVKQYIENLVNVKTAIVDAYAAYNISGKTTQDVEDFKAVYETYFDVENLIDYVIFSDVSNNYDGFNKNWQWLTYDSTKWYIGTYDTDGVFGGFFQLNNTIVPPLTNHLTIEKQSVASIGAEWVLTPIYDVYLNELESRYAQLRQMKIIDTNNIVSLMSDWLNRLGNKVTFDKEWTKWPGFIKNDSIHRLYKWVKASISNMDTLYNYNQN